MFTEFYWTLFNLFSGYDVLDTTLGRPQSEENTSVGGVS